MISLVIWRFRRHAWPNVGTHEDATLFRSWFDGIQHGRLRIRQYVVVIRVEANRRAKAAVCGEL